MDKLKDAIGIANEVTHRSRQIDPDQALLVAISGIDGSGKGYISRQISNLLAAQGMRTTIVHCDWWLNPPRIRFSQKSRALNFYERAIRFDEMFSSAIFPLKSQRSVEAVVHFAEETALELRKERYSIQDVDIVLLEGIYLFKKEFVGFYDYRIWVECSFETALERAIGRSQEGLSREQTIDVYRTIYFPAQQIHFRKDDPKSAADAVIENDKVK